MSEVAQAEAAPAEIAPAEIAPVEDAQRIKTLDVLRGLAILGAKGYAYKITLWKKAT